MNCIWIQNQMVRSKWVDYTPWKFKCETIQKKKKILNKNFNEWKSKERKKFKIFSYCQQLNAMWPIIIFIYDMKFQWLIWWETRHISFLSHYFFFVFVFLLILAYIPLYAHLKCIRDFLHLKKRNNKVLLVIHSLAMCFSTHAKMKLSRDEHNRHNRCR